MVSFPLYSQNNNSYFQQDLDYNINVSLNDKDHSLKGDISIVYKNNSPDNLNLIKFHLYPNAYRNNNTAFAKQFEKFGRSDFHFSKKSQRGYIDSMYFTINGKAAKFTISQKNPDLATLKLNDTLKPGEKIRIHTPFYVKLPEVFSRLGHNGQAYYITQWYPKPAVYDKHAWHHMPYLHMGEYYSEFADYNVKITLPQNYKIGASGKLMSGKEKMWLLSVNDPKTNKRIKSSKKRKTIHYKAKNVHDFAWFADKRYCVRHEKLNDSIDIYSFFLPESKGKWEKATKYIERSVLFYTEQVGKSHYQSYTAVQGNKGAGGGMEYPGVTIINNTTSNRGLEQVIMHEIGHNWFYGILGFNERDYPRLDEGLNSFYEKKYIEKYYPGDENELPDFLKGKNPYLNNGANLFSEFIYKSTRSLGIDQPADLSSADYHFVNYFSVIYNKTVSSLYYLEAWLGKQEFERIMKSFYNKWKNKHPGPDDLKNHFEKESKKETDWFFDGLTGSTDKVDYKIKSISKDSIKIVNRGKIKAPVFFGNDSTVFRKKGFTGEKSFVFNDNSDLDIKIDPLYEALEFNRSNDIYKRGLINHFNPPALRFFGGIDNPHINELYYLPVPAFNALDGFMPGLLIYNNYLPVKNFEYRIMPLFGIKSERLAGLATLSIRKNFNSKIFKNAVIEAGVKQFSQNEEAAYQKFHANLKLNFRIKDFNRNLQFFANNISVSNTNSSPLYYQQTGIIFSDRSAINPFEFKGQFEHGAAYVKFEFESRYHINYNEKYGLDIELFAGWLDYYDFENYPYNVNFRLSGTSMRSDYLFNMNHLNRSASVSDAEILTSHQFIPDEGGFSIYTPIQSNEWMSRIRLVSGTPLGFLNIYGSTAIIPNIDNYDDKFAFWESGIELSLIKDVLEIYIPLLYSKSLRDINEGIYTENFWQKIRFNLSLNALNPFDLRFKTHLFY